MKLLQGQKFSAERALYAADGLKLVSCAFEGEEDGESALKESKNIVAENCGFKLRYPLWHGENIALKDCKMDDACRAALWYSKDVKIDGCRLLGIKCLRECSGVDIVNSGIVSPEFGWKCTNVHMRGCSLKSEYAFLLSQDIGLYGVNFSGKYSFQYIKNAEFVNCAFDTKDAFWHAENVTVRDSVVKGEYLGWYSKNLTFENCKIIGTQPLCYCEGLRLINCQTENCDLAFEYSDVTADISGSILSVKNPKSGKIIAGGIGEIILTADSKYPCECVIAVK